ncbi:MAG: cupin domain-containing protein [Patescibacteria group bacterium]
MQVEKKPINFEDARGTIRDILIGVDVDAVTIITCAKNSVRGNHFHKKTTQNTYVVSGKLIYATQQDDGPIETKTVETGDITIDIPGSRHAFKALKDSVILQMSKGPRQGKEYESDTFRLEKPILS